MNTRTVVKVTVGAVLIMAVWIAAEVSPWLKTYGTGIALCLLTLIAIGGATLNLIASFGSDSEETSSSRALRPNNTPHLPVNPRGIR